jgi:hypothetical protein
MNQPQNWLEAWKTQAQNRQQRLAQALSQKPANQQMATLREIYMKRAQQAAAVYKNWAEAYGAHMKSIAEILANQPTKASSTPKGGSLGDAN